MFIGERLEEIRKDKGYSQAQLAKLVGVSTRSISAYENGETNPLLEHLITLSEILDISMDYLCGLTDIELPMSRTYYLPLSREYPEVLKQDLLEHLELLKLKYKVNK